MRLENLEKLSALRPIVLGSGSPRRFDLLTESGIQFRRLKPDLHEKQEDGEAPFDFAVRLAVDKAKAVAHVCTDGEVVIGCDTIVVLDAVVLGKPSDDAEAFATLKRLSGQIHEVCSAVALVSAGEVLAADRDVTQVKFNAVSDEQIRDYIATGEPSDKAGAYGIQGMGAFLVDSIEGELDTVIGLPRALLDCLAAKATDKLKGV